MVKAIENYFPKEVKYTNPKGGMFLWITLPEGLSAMKLFTIASEKRVFFVPGDQFYTNRTCDVNTVRLNFSCLNEQNIDKGIKLLATSIKELMDLAADKEVGVVYER